MNVLIGTSGFSYSDWKGPFYPKNIDSKEMLDYYAQFFKTIEINVTYYRIPHPNVFEKMMERVGSDFEFAVKAPRDFTHTLGFEKVLKEFNDSLSPLVRHGRLGAVLAQFPWSFKPLKQNLEYLKSLKHALPLVPFVTEFRHRSWIKESIFDFLKEENIAFCCVDEPNLPGLVPPVAQATSSTGYVRFHSRDGSKWWEGGLKGRYDYDYQDHELKEWIPKVLKLGKETQKIYIFFNNCHNGSAAKNALRMRELLSSGCDGGEGH
jgi:uncharacterized protein YecE (DUF72 family)